ncbi:MAG TPA: aldo/keto reductase [Deltaproteobacteria bacterium]|nr:aldo/keto reductase [Deltaproteobacteria bacterium]
MKQVKLNNADIGISAIILGTWAIGGSNWGHYDEKNAVSAVEAALDNGINAIDTAPVYGDGHAEELIGKVIRGKRDKVFLATKCGLDIYSRKYDRDLSSSYIEKDLHGSLERLNTDFIDLYQCHWPDPRTPVEETMSALLKFRQQGKIRHIGVSNFSRAEVSEVLRCAPIFSLQPHYSLLERSPETELLSFCVENNINVFPYGCLGAGMLTGKYRECPRFQKGDARGFFYRHFKSKYWSKVRCLIDEVEAISQRKGVTTGAVALSWLLGQPGIKSVIVGARSASQVVENIAGVPIDLSEDELRDLDASSRDVYEA